MASESSELFTLYRKSKIRFNRWMDDIIRRCNVTLLETEKIRNSYWRFFIQKLVLWIGNFALFLQQIPRSEAFALRGLSGGKVIYVGNQSQIPFLVQDVLAFDEFQVENLGRYNLWLLSAQAEQWLSEGAQLVVIALSPFYRWKFHSAFVIKIPYLIRQVMPLRESLDLLLSRPKYRNVRQKLNRILREGIQCKFSQKQEDFDLFYHQMYVPYTADRHGELALIGEYKDLWNYFFKGGLLMFYRGSDPVAGSVVMARGNTGIGTVGGVLDANQDLLRLGIYTMMIWESAKWAQSQGMSVLDMGAGYALRSNGIFRFKKSFGARVERCYNRLVVNRMAVHNNWTLLMQSPSPEFLEGINRTGLIVEHRRKFYGLVLENDTQTLKPEILSGKLKDALRDGLAGLAVLKPYQVHCFDASGDENQSE